MPKIISKYENEIKKIISEKVTRGKIDVLIDFSDYTENGKNVIINNSLAKMYIDQLRKLAKEQNLIDDISVMEIAKMPDVLEIESNDDDNEDILEDLKKCVNKALENFIDMRSIEGEKIKIDLQDRINKIDEYVKQISENSTGLIEDYVVKLGERIKEILKTDIIDEQRLAQETVIFADKSSIQEELTRLNSHIYQFKNLLDFHGAIGKKLDFIIQEMNRESNTIASKSYKLEITNLVIEIKTELEDIREQVQNIE